MIIRVDKFLGEMPRIPPKLLGPEYAQYAADCHLYNGKLKPLKAPLFVSGLAKVGTIKTIFLWGNQYWLHWTEDVNCVRGPIANDTTERTYWTGQDAPKVADSSNIVSGGGSTYPTAYYTLGIPAPAAVPQVTVEGDAGDDEAEVESRAYVYTYVSAWGEEGPPSPPSAVVDFYPDTQTISLSGLAGAPTGAYNIAAKYIYRTNTSETGTSYQYVGQVAVGVSTFPDTVTSDQLGEVLPSTEWYPPPTDMIGLTNMANGILAGFRGKDLCFSEAYMPHAWPPSYRLVTDYPIVSLGAFETNLVVTTKGSTYVATGVDPSAMTLTKLPIEQACTRKGSIANLGSIGVAYASPDGLIGVGSDSVTNLTESILARDEWQVFVPENIIGFGHNGKYHGFFQTSPLSGGFIFDPVTMSLVALTVDATGGFVNLVEDELYLIVDNDVYKWNAGTVMPYTWRSKIFETQRPCNFGIAQIYYSGGTTLTFKLYADGVLKHTQTVTSTNPFRLPSGYLAREWYFELSGDREVSSVAIGEVYTDLSQALGG